MIFMVSEPMTFANLAGTNFPRPLISMLSAALIRNSQIRAAFLDWHLILSTSVDSLSLVGPIPIKVLNILKGAVDHGILSGVSHCVDHVLKRWVEFEHFFQIENDCIKDFV